MTDREQYAMGPAGGAELCRFWCARVDELDRHLSTHVWAQVAAVTVALIGYPIARFVIPVALHAVLPDVVRNVLHLI